MNAETGYSEVTAHEQKRADKGKTHRNQAVCIPTTNWDYEKEQE